MRGLTSLCPLLRPRFPVTACDAKIRSWCIIYVAKFQVSSSPSIGDLLCKKYKKIVWKQFKDLKFDLVSEFYFLDVLNILILKRVFFNLTYAVCLTTSPNLLHKVRRQRVQWCYSDRPLSQTVDKTRINNASPSSTKNVHINLGLNHHDLRGAI